MGDAPTCPGCGAARNKVERCTADPGPPRTAEVPGLQRIIPLRFMLRCARDTRAQQNAFTIARAECFAKQGCSRCLFSSCSVLLSRAKSGDPRDAARADFPIYIPPLTGNGAAAGCGRPPVF